MTTILIVEDETNIRKFAAVNLAARGYEVIETDNAADGLTRLQESPPPALLLLDIRMAGMNGLDLLERMTEDPILGSIPVVVMTASATGALIEHQYPNITTVLIKPLSANRLMEAVKRSLDKGN